MTRNKFFRVIRLAPLAAALSAPIAVYAAPLVGNLALSTTSSQVLAVNGSVIDFNFTGPVTAGFPPTSASPLTVNGAGTFDIGAASTGSFAGLIGTTVSVKDLDASQQPTGSLVGPGLPLENFITFAAQPGWSITLTQVLPGVFSSAACGAPAASGQTCTPADSPFNMTNIAGAQVNVNFAFTGIADDGQGNLSNISGTFGTTFSSTSFQAILAAINNGQAVVTTASGTLGAAASPVPEPGTSVLLGLSLIGFAALTRSARARRQRS